MNRVSTENFKFLLDPGVSAGGHPEISSCPKLLSSVCSPYHYKVSAGSWGCLLEVIPELVVGVSAGT